MSSEPATEPIPIGDVLPDVLAHILSHSPRPARETK